MKEQSIEELQTELETLKKANLEKEIAEEKAKIEAEELKKKEEETIKLRETIRAEMEEEQLKEKGEKSNIPVSEKLARPTKGKFSMEKLKKGFILEVNRDLKRHHRSKDAPQVTGDRKYEDIVEDLCLGDYK